MKVIFLMVFLVITSCQSTPAGSVILSNDPPPGDCVTVGQVIGNSSSREHSKEKALEDLKHQAAMKSANFVRVLAVAAYGSSARGIAYRCR